MCVLPAAAPSTAPTCVGRHPAQDSIGNSFPWTALAGNLRPLPSGSDQGAVWIHPVGGRPYTLAEQHGMLRLPDGEKRLPRCVPQAEGG
jgi:hypothetical protein